MGLRALVCSSVAVDDSVERYWSRKACADEFLGEVFLKAAGVPLGFALGGHVIADVNQVVRVVSRELCNRWFDV
jgi:hypothetical protein